MPFARFIKMLARWHKSKSLVGLIYYVKRFLIYAITLVYDQEYNKRDAHG